MLEAHVTWIQVSLIPATMSHPEHLCSRSAGQGHMVLVVTRRQRSASGPLLSVARVARSKDTPPGQVLKQTRTALVLGWRCVEASWITWKLRKALHAQLWGLKQEGSLESLANRERLRRGASQGLCLLTNVSWGELGTTQGTVVGPFSFV